MKKKNQLSQSIAQWMYEHKGVNKRILRIDKSARETARKLDGRKK